MNQLLAAFKTGPSSSNVVFPRELADILRLFEYFEFE